MTGNDHDRLPDELKIFHDVAKALTSSLDLDIILQTILEKVAAYFRPEAWSLLMIDEHSRQLYYAVAVGESCDLVNALKLTTGESLGQWVIENNQALVITDVHSDLRIDPHTAALFSEACSIVCIPVAAGGRVQGIMQLMNSDLRIVSRGEMLLQALADYVAIAIQNARAVQRIQELSVTDDCTGLYNARHMFTMLNDEVRRSERFGYEFSIIFIDLDHFKRINDAYGHVVGSKLLGQFGAALRRNLRLVDAAFRYGGDEFAVLLPQTNKKSALFVARRQARMFRDTLWLSEDGLSLVLRASIGIATYPQDGTTPQAIVQVADHVMYQVKQAGRNNIAVAGQGVVGMEDQPSAQGMAG